MSEEHDERHPEGRDAGPAGTEEGPPPAEPSQRSRGASRGTPVWAAAALVLVVAGVAFSPYWAPDLAPLLPWGEKTAITKEDYAALEARLTAIEKRPATPGVDVGAINSAESALSHRIERLEAEVNRWLADIEKRPVPPGMDTDAIKSAESALAHRVDQLEAARDADRQTQATVAAAKAGLQQLDQRLGAIEAQSSSRAADEAAELQKIQQELGRLGSLTGDLATRIPALERQIQSHSGGERNDAALALVLLRMREAVDQARPFSAEYNTFAALARHSDLAAAAEPLAEAARDGIASRAVLSKRLAEIAGQITTAPEPPAESDWGAQALARLRSLVTIRRIDGSPQTGPEAAVSAAQTALVRGDLAEAVAALDKLSGANARAAGPWLRVARERLAVEAALDHLEELLAARLGGTPAAPAEPSAKAKAPS